MGGTAKHPRRHDFYVYAFEARGRIFYVGIGRDKRASDRVRWVKSQMARQANGKPPKWVLHTKVMRELLKKGESIQVRYLHNHINRAEALRAEQLKIKRLRSKGVMLANCQYNDGGPPLNKVLRALFTSPPVLTVIGILTLLGNLLHITFY